VPQRPAAPRFPVVAWLESRSRRQRQLALGVVIVVAAWRLLGLVADIAVSRWWFDSVTDAPVWSSRLQAQAMLAVSASAITLVLLGTTVWLTLVSGRRRGQARWIRTYHDRVGPAHRWVAYAIVVLVTWRVGRAATGAWQDWLLFRHGGDLGVRVPELGGDLGQYLFDLPFLALVSSWIRQLLLAAIVIAVIGHVLSGAMKIPFGHRRSTALAKGHVALLVAALAAAQALHLVVVQRRLLAVDRSGSFDGAGYVQLNVIQPALWILAITALVTGMLLVDGVRRNRWRPAGIAAATWLVLSGLLLLVVPALVQNFVVRPAEAERELSMISHNLEATTTAYRLDLVDSRTQTFTDGLVTEPTPQQLDDVDRIPVFDTSQLVSSFQVLQGTTATRITDIDLDRYELDGERQPVMVAVRGASRNDLPESGWVQEHLVYTHGNGIVAAPANVPATDGRPDLIAASDLQPVRDEVYFGESLDSWYAIVGTRREEQGGARFDADTGIELSSVWRRLFVALSLGEVDPLLSSELTSESQLLMRRSLGERLGELAPFLAFDSQPHAAVVGDRIVWIVDGYTTSSTYPYAQFAPTTGLPGSSDLAGRAVNSVRGSVKATVDAYSGEVHLYRTATTGAADPILDVWSDVFPGLIEPIDEMPAEIQAHLRYPADLMTIQSELLGRYHVDTPEALFDGTQRWSVSPATSPAVGVQPEGVAPAVDMFAAQGTPWAGEFVSVRTYNPGSSSNASSARDGLAAFLVASHDDPERLTLVDVDAPTSRQITSSQVAQSIIEADPDLAREFTFLNSNGSQVTFGPMTMIPLGDAIVWMRPVIVNGTSPASTPHLYKVLVVSNGVVGQGETAAKALSDATSR
jgi:uncharacterized membrane protein (UPF0182 family)